MAASQLLDVVRFNPTSGGTTDWTVSSAVTGYQTPASGGAANGAQYSYRAESSDLTQWEVGVGTYNTTGPVLSRTTVLFNSSGTTSKINFSAAPQVSVVALKEDIAGKVIGAGVGLGGTNFTYVPPSPNKYRLISWTAVQFNQDNLWAAQANLGAAFIVPAGKSLVHVDAQIWVTSGAAAASANWVVKWIKNATIDGSSFLTGGTDMLAGIGTLSQGGTGTVVTRASGVFGVSPGDYFAPFLFCDSTTLGSTTLTIDGNNAHTYATAAVLA